MTNKTLRIREWIAVHVLRLDQDLFDRAPIDSTCAGCAKAFKLLDGLAGLHETSEEVNHFLMALGIWWVHNMLRTRSLTALMATFAETLTGAGVPVIVAPPRPSKKEAYVAH